MSFKSAQLQSFSLQGSGCSVSDTTLNLSSFKSIDGVDLALADFGTAGYMTIEPGSRDREEQISFSGITQNADGTATLTGIKTVLFLSPYTETSGFSKSHPGGVVAVVSNTSGFYNKLTAKDNNEVITGYWTVPDPVSMTDIANKEYVLSVVTGGSVSINQLIVAGTAGETVSAGQILYFKAADGRWWKASSAATGTTDLLQLGVSQGAGTAGNSITGGVLLRGVDANQSGLTGGVIYYLSTGGAISSSAGTVERAIGQANSTTTLYFDPVYFYVPTALQKAALAGNGGTLSSTNKYVTGIGQQNSIATYAADAGANDTYAITLTPVPTAYVTGMQVTFKANTANTGAATLNVNALGAITIKKDVSLDLATGDILASQDVTVFYDGTNFQILSRTSNMPTRTAFIASGTWTKPTGLKYATIELVACGGGGGGNASGAAGESGGGGGAGGYSRKTVATATLGTTETVTIGAAGTAGANTGTDGGTGGTVSFGAHATATGGSGGKGASGNPSVGRGGAGGVGSSGDINSNGNAGSPGSISTGSAAGGSGGASYFGGGAIGGTNSAGSDGVAYGGGGGGGGGVSSAAAGGAGAVGYVIVTEYY